jgi:hypothetical protein
VNTTGSQMLVAFLVQLLFLFGLVGVFLGRFVYQSGKRRRWIGGVVGMVFGILAYSESGRIPAGIDGLFQVTLVWLVSFFVGMITMRLLFEFSRSGFVVGAFASLVVIVASENSVVSDASGNWIFWAGVIAVMIRLMASGMGYGRVSSIISIGFTGALFLSIANAYAGDLRVVFDGLSGDHDAILEAWDAMTRLGDSRTKEILIVWGVFSGVSTILAIVSEKLWKRRWLDWRRQVRRQQRVRQVWIEKRIRMTKAFFKGLLPEMS